MAGSFPGHPKTALSDSSSQPACGCLFSVAETGIIRSRKRPTPCPRLTSCKPVQYITVYMFPSVATRHELWPMQGAAPCESFWNHSQHLPMLKITSLQEKQTTNKVPTKTSSCSSRRQSRISWCHGNAGRQRAEGGNVSLLTAHARLQFQDAAVLRQSLRLRLPELQPGPGNGELQTPPRG